MAMKKLYWEFHDLYVKAHPNLSKAQCNDEANEKWNSMKKDKKAVDMDVYNREVGTLKSKLIKRKSTMFDFLWKKLPLHSHSHSTESTGKHFRRILLFSVISHYLLIILFPNPILPLPPLSGKCNFSLNSAKLQKVF